MSVRRVWLESLGLVDEFLVEEELTDVGDVATSESLVLSIDSGVDVSKNCSVVSTCFWKLRLQRTVYVSGASSVVARESGVKLQDAVIVAELDAAEHGVVDVACIS